MHGDSMYKQRHCTPSASKISLKVLPFCDQFDHFLVYLWVESYRLRVRRCIMINIRRQQNHDDRAELRCQRQWQQGKSKTRYYVRIATPNSVLTHSFTPFPLSQHTQTYMTKEQQGLSDSCTRASTHGVSTQQKIHDTSSSCLWSPDRRYAIAMDGDGVGGIPSAECCLCTIHNDTPEMMSRDLFNIAEVSRLLFLLPSCNINGCMSCHCIVVFV